MITVRAKFVCDSVTEYAGTQKHYEFRAVTDDNTPENLRYHKYTPNGSLKMSVDNPDVSFKPGQSYYLDFTPVEDN